MTHTFDSNEAEKLVRQLTNSGVEFEVGLSEYELEIVEKSIGYGLPEDYRLFLKTALPVSYKGNYEQFPKWRSNPEEEAHDTKANLYSLFEFDIINNNFWHSSFGEKPNTTAEAIKQAINIVDSWPPLIRIYAHRFIPSKPSSSGNAIFSIWQATDSVYYGVNLSDALLREFKINDASINYKKITPIEHWSEVFGLV